MPHTQTNCPRCRQPIVADIQQLFDMNVDSTAKQRLLSGAFNIAKCPSCGFEGRLNIPIVYHDPQKEFLLTFFPSELGTPINEQEKILGPLINQVVNKLPPEKRKAYLLRSQTMLTLQTLFEKVLEGDGITREMIDAQQKQLSLIQRLITVAPEKRIEMIKQEEKTIDENFIAMLTRLAEAARAQGDEKSSQALVLLQRDILNETEIGRAMQTQVQETQEAIKSLQELNKEGLTREKLLELVIKAPNETRLLALINLAHSALDYQFFQMLTERINHSSGEEKERLSTLRDKILEITSDIEKEMQAQAAEAKNLLDSILSAPNVEEATTNHLGEITNVFLDILNTEIQRVRQKGDLERGAKLQKINAIIEKASAPPPEVALIEKLLSAQTDDALNQALEAHSKEITPEFLQIFNGLVMQTEEQKQASPEALKRLKEIYQTTLRFSMKVNLSK